MTDTRCAPPLYPDLEQPMPESGWVTPDDPSIAADYWLTRKAAEALPGYGGFNDDIRVKYRWNGQDSWVTGWYQGRQRMEPCLVSLHRNNGWRLEGRA